MLDTFNTDNQFFRIKKGTYERGHICISHILDDQLPHLWHQQYYLGATHIFREVSCRLTSKVVVIGSSETNWNCVRLIHGVNFPAEFISSCFINYITSFFPICVQSRGTGPKLKAYRNRNFFTESPRSIKGVTRRIPSMIGLFKRIPWVLSL